MRAVDPDLTQVNSRIVRLIYPVGIGVSAGGRAGLGEGQIRIGAGRGHGLEPEKYVDLLG